MNFHKRPKKVWVFFGGPSGEREVSIKTGRGIEEALRAKNFEVEAFDVRPGRGLLDLNWNSAPDIVFIALHGPFGEDGTVQGFLDSIQVPYVGSGVSSSAVCMHKGLSKKQLESHGLPCPKGFEITGMDGLSRFLSAHTKDPKFFEHKYFIKPAREGSTIGIERFMGTGGSAEFERLCQSALKFDECLIVEEWIEGPELTVPLFDGRAMPIVEIRPREKFYNYESKYTVGKTDYFCPAPITPQQTTLCQQLAEKAFKVLECRDYGRVDFMLGARGPVILEMNTLPGMTETSLVPKSAVVAGMDYASFVERLVCKAYERASQS